MKVIIDDQAMTAMRELFVGTKFTAERTESGDWLIEIEDPTLNRIQRAKLPGESLSDVVLRAVNKIRSEN